MSNELSEEVRSVESLVQIARNQKPRQRGKTGLTRAEEDVLIGDLCRNIQSKLIAFECLKAAVKESKDNKAISKRGQELLTYAIAKANGED